MKRSTFQFLWLGSLFLGLLFLVICGGLALYLIAWSLMEKDLAGGIALLVLFVGAALSALALFWFKMRTWLAAQRHGSQAPSKRQ